MSKISAELVRRLPGIGWRQVELDKRKNQLSELRVEAAEQKAAIAQQRDQIERQRRTIADLEAESTEQAEFDRGLQSIEARPSFARSLSELRRVSPVLQGVDPGYYHPLRQLPRKLHNYRLAMSHGVAVPEVFGVWHTLDDIDLSAMPDKFVLKSDGGAGGHGVLPLIRRGVDSFDLVGGSATFTTATIRERLASRKSLLAPYFAEEFLDQPAGGTLPDDIKFYSFYGDVQLALLLGRVTKNHELRSAGRRYVAMDGTDLGDAKVGVKSDPSLELPRDFHKMAEQARHLSRAVGVPFVRVDLYQTPEGPVLGEITRAPGGSQTLVPHLDEALGLAWDRARMRVETDVSQGRPFGRVYGDLPAPNPYPQEHWSQQPGDNAWTPTVRPCAQWCQDER